MKFTINALLYLLVCTATMHGTKHDTKLAPEPQGPADQIIIARGPFTNGYRRIPECMSKELEAIEYATLNKFRLQQPDRRYPDLNNPKDFSECRHIRDLIRADVDHNPQRRKYVDDCYRHYHKRYEKLPTIISSVITHKVTPNHREQISISYAIINNK